LTDHPILFSAHMVRALLDGRKTQTRRLLKPQPRQNDQNAWYVATRAGFLYLDGIDLDLVSRHAPGDRLWVRETLRANSNDQGARWYSYAADGADVWPLTEWYKTRDTIVSIHMPRWASRITLLVTDVRVQRLQDISEADAQAEGAQLGMVFEREAPTYRAGFQDLWDSLNADRAGGAYAWAANPWVTATTFKVIKGNIYEVKHG
jgi:hypothetical protein